MNKGSFNRRLSSILRIIYRVDNEIVDGSVVIKNFSSLPVEEKLEILRFIEGYLSKFKRVVIHSFDMDQQDSVDIHYLLLEDSSRIDYGYEYDNSQDYIIDVDPKLLY